MMSAARSACQVVDCCIACAVNGVEAFATTKDLRISDSAEAWTRNTKCALTSVTASAAGLGSTASDSAPPEGESFTCYQ